MAEQQATPDAVTKIRVSQVTCDVQAGPWRCIAQLAAKGSAAGVKAIWRNEIGPAACTGPRVSA